MGEIEDFAGMAQYALLDELFQNTNAARKNIRTFPAFRLNAALAPHALNMPRNLTPYVFLFRATRMTRAQTM